MRRESMSLARALAPVDWTSWFGDLRAREKAFRIGRRSAFSVPPTVVVVVFGSEGGSANRDGCVIRMSAMICRAMVWRAGWPFVKQWRKRVRFSSARFCHDRH